MPPISNRRLVIWSLPFSSPCCTAAPASRESTASPLASTKQPPSTARSPSGSASTKARMRPSSRMQSTSTASYRICPPASVYRASSASAISCGAYQSISPCRASRVSRPSERSRCSMAKKLSWWPVNERIMGVTSALTELPPRRMCRSTIRVRSPFLAQVIPALAPAEPPPAMTASQLPSTGSSRS